eukprot:3532929-Pleurochrysis_carterae.AAC.1
MSRRLQIPMRMSQPMSQPTSATMIHFRLPMPMLMLLSMLFDALIHRYSARRTGCSTAHLSPDFNPNSYFKPTRALFLAMFFTQFLAVSCPGSLHQIEWQQLRVLSTAEAAEAEAAARSTKGGANPKKTDKAEGE